jgi:hypothetical protein
MAKLGDLVVGVGANTNDFNHKMREVRKQMATTMGEVKNIGKSLSIGLTAPLAIMGATSVKAFQVQAKAIAQVEAGLKSTGNQAGYTSKQLQAMASDLQGKTLFGDEVILKDATAQLLTFTNISGEQFKRTQEAALDLATRLDGDLKGASIQLGKALNDPVANLSALSRSGIQFSEEQKAVIKSLAETGRLAEAQTLILDELNKQYGGSAEAAAKADGGFTQLANAFGDLQEVIGQTLMPILTPIVQQITKMIQMFQQAPEGVKLFGVTIAGLAAAIGPLLFTIPTLIGNFKLMKTALKSAKAEMLAFNAATLANPYVLAAAAIVAIGVAMYGLYDASTDAEDKVADLRAELNGMEGEEAARHAAKRIKEQEEAVKKQLEAVKALRAAANMGDATDRRIHSQTLARQEEVLANEEAKLQGFKREAFLLEGRQQYEEMLVRTKQAQVNAEDDLVQSKEEALAAAKEQAELEKWLADFRTLMAEDITIEPVVRPQFDPSGLELTGIEDIPDMARDMTEQFDDEFQVDEVAFAKWQAAQDRMAMFKDASGKMFDYMANNAANWGNSLGQAFGLMAQGAEQGKEAMKSATKGIISQSLAAAQASIIEAMINSGKFSGPAAPVVIPALVAGGIGLIQSLFADIPAFAAGGIVSGPTVGLMGEYPGAKTNPEVIAPLDKLQSMLQADKQQVVVSGRIDGNSIRLANDRTNRNAKRFLR